MQRVLPRTCWILIMMCLGFNLQAQQARLEQRFTFNFSNHNLHEALQQIEDDANVRFSYVSKEVSTGKLGMNFTNTPLHFILHKIFSPYNLSCIYIGQNSYVVRKENVEFEFTYQVSGFVRDLETNEPIANVIVSSPTERISTFTTDSGYYHMRLSQSPQDLIFVADGYHTTIRVANQAFSFYQVVQMEKNRLMEVTKRLTDTMSLSMRSSGAQLNFAMLDKTPSVHTAQGVLNSVKFIAGFQSTLDANGGISVRGGGVHENLVLYDGVLIYNAMHLPGWFSVFSKRSVDKAELIKGGFNSNFGGRTSSVIDNRSKPGNYKKYIGGVSISPVSTEAYIEGPLIRDKMSFMVSARRSFTDFWSPVINNILSDNGLNNIRFYLYDINAGVDWKTGVNSTLKVRYYRGGDKGYLNEKLRISDNVQIREDNRQSYLWGNSLTSAEWVKMINKSLNISAMSYYTRFGFKLDNSYSIRIAGEGLSTFEKSSELSYGNSIYDIGNQFRINWRISPRHSLHSGVEAISHQFVPPSTEYSNTINGEIADAFQAGTDRIKGVELNAFTSYTYSARKIMLRGGLRYSQFRSDRIYQVFQPRILANYYPRSDMKIYAHYDRMNQFVFAVLNNETGLQYAVWLPVSGGLEPIQSDQVSVGFTKRFKRQTQFLAEGYYKSYSVTYDYHNRSIDLLKDWQQQLSKGTGYSKGLEFTFKTGKANWNGWVAYTLSKAERKFSNINEGRFFPFQFNRTHDLSVFYNRYLPGNWIIGGSWIYASGNYITIPESRYIVEFEGELLIAENFGSKNNYRLPAYHRLDIGVSKIYEKEKFTHRISLSVYNAYFNQNPYYVTLSFNESGKPVLNQVSLLPLMPILQYAVEIR